MEHPSPGVRSLHEIEALLSKVQDLHEALIMTSRGAKIRLNHMLPRWRALELDLSLATTALHLQLYPSDPDLFLEVWKGGHPKARP